MVHGCMVYTEIAPRRLQFRAAPALPALKYITLVDFFFFLTAIKLVTLINVESHASAVSLLERAENSAI